MASFLFKWLLIGGLVINPMASYHPIFVSVTEIEHNAKDKSLEISCKIFTDDLETTLRTLYKTPVDLLKPKDKKAMEKLVAGYVQNHLQVKVDGKPVSLEFLGYEQDEEGIISYYQVNNVAVVKKLDVANNILFEYKKEQMSIIHTSVNGIKKSTKLLNPEYTYSFEF